VTIDDAAFEQSVKNRPIQLRNQGSFMLDGFKLDVMIVCIPTWWSDGNFDRMNIDQQTDKNDPRS
jgi:hypothetical protein